MRLFLDAQVSAAGSAAALRERHDVRAADEERDSTAADDAAPARACHREERIIGRIQRQRLRRITIEWAAASRSHAGCLLIVGIDHAEFGAHPPRDRARTLDPAPPSCLVRLRRLGQRSATTYETSAPATTKADPRPGSWSRSAVRRRVADRMDGTGRSTSERPAESPGRGVRPTCRAAPETRCRSPHHR